LPTTVLSDQFCSTTQYDQVAFLFSRTPIYMKLQFQSNATQKDNETLEQTTYTDNNTNINHYELNERNH